MSSHPNRNRSFARLTAIAVLALLFCLVGTSAAAAADRWIHVKIDGDNGEEVIVNLPITVMSAAAAMIPEEVREETRVALDEAEMDWTELRNLWDALKDSPDSTFMTIKTQDQNLEIFKDGPFLRITGGEEIGASIDVTFPMSVVDALFSGPEGELDFEAALQALADYGPGNLVTIIDDDKRVRVWIDSNPEAE
ncbi:MAG: hypothetical protein AAF772_04670 [Acidobacteriota bacterium]